jgi:hypothetical protein
MIEAIGRRVYSAWAETVLKAGTSNLTGPIENSITKASPSGDRCIRSLSEAKTCD